MSTYRLGYARVSTLEQDPRLQLDALDALDADQVFVDYATGALMDRSQLAALIERDLPEAGQKLLPADAAEAMTREAHDVQFRFGRLAG